MGGAPSRRGWTQRVAGSISVLLSWALSVALSTALLTSSPALPRSLRISSPALPTLSARSSPSQLRTPSWRRRPHGRPSSCRPSRTPRGSGWPPMCSEGPCWRVAPESCARVRVADGLRRSGAETAFAMRWARCRIAAGGDEPGRLGRRATDPEFLSRVQFALTASFHFLYPPLSMGLGLMMVVIGVAYARTKDPKWRQLSFFWVKIYGLIFAMGVATGIVQEFEFGMNWADYSRFVGNVFGSLLAAEGVFAFALEGGFLGPAAVRRQPARPAPVAVRDGRGGVRRPLQRPLDHHGQLLDADAPGLHDRHRSGAGARGHDRLLAGRVHAVVRAPAAARVLRLVDRRGRADDERRRLLRPPEAAPRAGRSQPEGRTGRVHPVRDGELRARRDRRWPSRSRTSSRSSWRRWRACG